MFLSYIAAFFSSIYGENLFQFIFSFIDLFLVFYFVYTFFRLIKGTKSAQILFGFFVLVLVFLLGKVINLRATVWLLDGFFQYFIILVIIIFQGEIKTILSSFELFDFFKKTDSGFESFFLIEELTEALFTLASQRDGALILVTLKGDPAPFVTGGVMLDANVKKELLISIFRKQSPIHDGAVIIKNGRIHKAGVFLPLSTSTDLDPNFGTRHRAAYGISEEVDSMVFVVSEERGQVSLLMNGRITRNLTRDMTKKILNKYLKESK